MNTLQTTIKKTHLFESLSDSEFQSVVDAAPQVAFPAGHLIVDEGEKGNECFVILQGAVQVFTTRADGTEIVLAKLHEGEFIGEQALLPGGTGRRNASLRAYTDVSLLKISKQNFQQVLSRDNPLKNRLLRRGKRQIRAILQKQSILFRSLPMDEIPEQWYREEAFADGTIIFHEGETGDKVYFIISGKADVYREVNDNMQFLLQLKSGFTFGERAFLENKPRGATVIAHGPLRVFSIDGKHFLWLYKKSPKVQKYMQSLKRIYPLAGRGYVTQFEGHLMGLDCLTTVCTTSDGTTIVCSQVIGEDIFNLSITGAQNNNLEKIRYENPNQGIERELVLSDRRIVGVTTTGFWEELGQTYEAVLDKIPLNKKQIRLFQTEGKLKQDFSTPVFYEEQQVVCNCLQICFRDLCEGHRKKFKDADRLMEETGAGTVCGCCVFVLKDILGETPWTPVRISKAVAVAQGIESFTLEPIDRTVFKAAKPGQHILIQGLIGGKWVQRPYTISSAATDVNTREITVKREQYGAFSKWVFDAEYSNARIRVSDPQGDFAVDLSQSEPSVFIAGGIGITPALAICRTLIREGLQLKLHIDYSVRSPAHIACQDELETAAEYDNISINIRVTENDNRISAADIRRIIVDYPDAQYYLCGPGLFMTTVTTYLKMGGTPLNRIHVEEFTPVGDRLVTRTKDYFYIGISLLIVFIVQDAFQIKWPWLEKLQTIENYRIGSGIFLASYVAVQLFLPLSRWNGDLKLATHRYQLHKIQGAFAPLIYYIHTTQLGNYGYLGIISIVFFANVGLGLFNHERITNPDIKPVYSYYWLIVHIVLSILLIALIPFHAYIAFAYK